MSKPTETINPFPQDLPPRTQQQPAARTKSYRTCLTCHFLSSYSLRNIPDARTKWRRTGMCALLVFLFGTMVWSIVNFFVAVLSPIGAVLIIVDIAWFWVLAFSIARIGDAVGVRRVCGILFGRTFFDSFILVCLVVYIALWLASLFFLGFIIYEILWCGVGIFIVLVAGIASKPPIYPEGVV